MTPPTIEDLSPRSCANQNDDVHDLALAKRRRFFCLPFGDSGGRGSVFWQRINPHYDGSNPDTQPSSAASRGGGDPWWTRGWRKVREWSEIVLGPRWKTLIRRFNVDNKKRRGGGGRGKFQYDALSYSLNFDEGPGWQHGYSEHDEYFSRGFCSRYSLPPSAKSSLDFDSEGISFT